MYVEGIVLENLAMGKFGACDRVSRRLVQEVYARQVSRWEWDRVIEFIDSVTGGLAYRCKGWDMDFGRMTINGSIIAWADAVKDGDLVLEIGTGLGRTAFTVLYSIRPRLYLTIDKSPIIVAIAMFRNPIPHYQSIFNNKALKIAVADAVKAVSALRLCGIRFDHIVHDGGPNPRRNPRLFSESFLKALLELLKPGGRLSVFAGKDPMWVSRIFKFLRGACSEAFTVTFQDSKTCVVRCIK